MLVRTYANANELVQGETLKVFPARTRPQDGDATVRTDGADVVVEVPAAADLTVRAGA